MVYAEERSCITQFELGQMFRKSEDSTQNAQQAAEWFKRSAKNGYQRAQYTIGLMYARGMGVRRDRVRAYAWLKLAASQGSKKALRSLSRVTSKMDMVQLQRAHQLTRRYYNNYVAPFAGRKASFD